MKDIGLEESEEDAEEASDLEQISLGHTNRRHWPISCLATGVYIDLLTRPEQGRIEEVPVNTPEQNTLNSLDTADTIRTSIIGTSPAGPLRCSELNLGTQIQSNLDVTSCLQGPNPEIHSEGQLLTDANLPFLVEEGAPPSYTSLPPPLSIGLPPIVHSPPPPSYEQAVGLRYLDSDQPVLVFNTQDMWGYRPQLAYCLVCNAMVLTFVHTEYCHVTHLTALLSFLFCCWPCCVLPYFIPALKEAHHHCPACNNHLGTYYPFSGNG